jgi:hypothetical protein
MSLFALVRRSGEVQEVQSSGYNRLERGSAGGGEPRRSVRRPVEQVVPTPRSSERSSRPHVSLVTLCSSDSADVLATLDLLAAQCVRASVELVVVHTDDALPPRLLPGVRYIMVASTTSIAERRQAGARNATGHVVMFASGDPFSLARRLDAIGRAWPEHES